MNLEQNKTRSRGPVRPLDTPSYMNEGKRVAEPIPFWVKATAGAVVTAALVAANYIGASKVEDNYPPSTPTEQPSGDRPQAEE